MILMFTGGGLGARLSPMVTWGRLSAGQPGASPILAGFLHYTGFNAPMQSFNTSQIVLWQSNLLTVPCPLIILFYPTFALPENMKDFNFESNVFEAFDNWLFPPRLLCPDCLHFCCVQIAYIVILHFFSVQIAILLGCIEIDPHKRLSCLRQDRFSDHLQYDSDHLHQSIEWSFTTLRQDISTRIFHPAHRQH